MGSMYMIGPDGNLIMNPNQQFMDPNLFNRPDVKDGNIVFNELVKAKDQANIDKQNAHSLLFNNMVTKAANNKDFRKTFLEAYGYKENELDKFTNDVKAAGLKINGVDFKNTTFMAGVPGDKKNVGYIAKNANEDIVRAFTTADGLAETNLVATQTKLQLNEKEIATRLGVKNIDEYVSNKLKKEGFTNNIKIGDMTFTPMEVYNLSKGQTVLKNGNIISYTNKEDTPWYYGLVAVGGEGRQGKTNPGQLYVNGKLLGTSRSSGEIGAFADYENKMNSWWNGIDTDELTSVRSQVYKKSEWENKNYIQTYDNESPVIQSIQSKLSVDGKTDKNISISGFAGDGEIVISVPGGDGSTARTLGTMGMGAVEDLGNGYYSIKNTGYAVLNQPINNPYIRSVGNSIAGITATKQFEIAEPGSIVQTLDIPLWIAGNHTRGNLSVIKIGENNARYDLHINDKDLPTYEPVIQSPNALSFINQYSQLLAPPPGK
jgi:hypothetical protein